MSTSVASPPAEPATATAAAPAAAAPPARPRSRGLRRPLHPGVGRPPAVDRLARRQPDLPGGVQRGAGPAHRRVLHGDPGPPRVRLVPLLPPGAELGAGHARPPGHHRPQRPPPAGGLPGRRLHADPAARPSGRPHALPHLLRVPRAAGRHRDPRDRPPGPREPQVPPRHDVPGVLLRGRRRRPGVPGRHRLGHRPPLRAAPVPHPHQDQARARRDPRRVPG